MSMQTRQKVIWTRKKVKRCLSYEQWRNALFSNLKGNIIRNKKHHTFQHIVRVLKLTNLPLTTPKKQMKPQSQFKHTISFQQRSGARDWGPWVSQPSLDSGATNSNHRSRQPGITNLVGHLTKRKLGDLNHQTPWSDRHGESTWFKQGLELDLGVTANDLHLGLVQPTHEFGDEGKD